MKYFRKYAIILVVHVAVPYPWARLPFIKGLHENNRVIAHVPVLIKTRTSGVALNHVKMCSRLAAKMKLVLLLLWFKALDISAQYREYEAPAQYSDSDCRVFNSELNDDFFDALRKVESDGDFCKVTVDARSNSTKLGPYQISEEYYNDAVEFDPRLKTGGNL